MVRVGFLEELPFLLAVDISTHSTWEVNASHGIGVNSTVEDRG